MFCKIYNKMNLTSFQRRASGLALVNPNICASYIYVPEKRELYEKQISNGASYHLIKNPEFIEEVQELLKLEKRHADRPLNGAIYSRVKEIESDIEELLGKVE